MHTDHDEQQFEPANNSRRNFIASSMRVLAFGAIGVYATDQHFKRKRLENDPNCVKIHTCTQCIEFGGCEKPKADEARHAFPSEV